MNQDIHSEKVYLPLMLEVSKKNILLIGGGSACAEKLRTLSQLGKRVTAIAPEFSDSFDGLDWIDFIYRKYMPGDLKNYDIAYVGINNFSEEMKILEEAKLENVLVNFVDQPAFSDFISASVLIKKFFSIFISTNGRGPGAAKMIRKEIESKLDLDALNERAGEFIAERKKKMEDKNSDEFSA